MRIAIVSTARSHLLDVAISLKDDGHDVLFYTVIPKKRCEKFGLSSDNVISFFSLIGFLFIHKKLSFKYKIKPYLISLIDYFFDYLTSKTIKECDVFIGDSIVAIKSSRKARVKYGAFIISDCGTKHVIEQNRILTNYSGTFSIYKKVISNQLLSYDFSDKIVLPSTHSFDSFVKHGINSSKIFINPYGVNLDMFYPTHKPEDDAFDVIFVGSWRYIKGCDLLAEACLNRLKIKLLHVGSVFGDLPLPVSPFFTHVNPVPQNELIKYYNRAKIFVLPSRAEGLALVQAQAIVCGLPVVYSYHTGGKDLNDLIGGSEYLFQIPELNIDSLVDTISKALEKSNDQRKGELRNYVGDNLENLSWRSYGKRYSEFLEICL